MVEYVCANAHSAVIPIHDDVNVFLCFVPPLDRCSTEPSLRPSRVRCMHIVADSILFSKYTIILEKNANFARKIVLALIKAHFSTYILL